jgi:2-oxoglutarate ferredoxin oxidoreductase subunit alpha
MVKDPLSQEKNDISIVLCGQAGMGIQTVEGLLTRILKAAGYNVFTTKEYMSRVRGGTNSTEIRIASQPVRGPVDRMDILIPFDEGAIGHLRKRISPDTLMLAEKAYLPDEYSQGQFNFVDVPFIKTATEIGSKVYSNTVAVGLIAGLLRISPEPVGNFIKQFFVGKSEKVIAENIKAAETGHKIGDDLVKSGRFSLEIGHHASIEEHILLSGSQAIGLGAIAGGCNFISSYPMSPSTGVLVFLARHAADFGMIVEQAEDEIAAINMAVGASYAGARAMVTTSGGGFALMTEGLSLAGMLETPIVIHLGQRPGPATGLPTRTEQADLELALYAGHGEFPRIILSPGNIDEAFFFTQKAFNLADKYQIPVFILTDQYLLDSYYNTPVFDLSATNIENHIIKSKKNYKRYELTENGISPRSVPDYGDGLVCVDSDEHDTTGHITEDLELRTKMVDKRLRKLPDLQNEALTPELIPNHEYENLVVCWGSTCDIVKEALAELARDNLSLLHFKQVHPLHASTTDYLRKAKRIILIENNATGQFGKLLKLNAGIEIDEKILKYNGLSFTVEEIVERLNKILD